MHRTWGEGGGVSANAIGELNFVIHFGYVRSSLGSKFAISGAGCLINSFGDASRLIFYWVLAFLLLH